MIYVSDKKMKKKKEKAHYLVLWHIPKVSCQEQTLNVVVCSFIQQIWNPGINLGTVEAAVNKTRKSFTYEIAILVSENSE